MPYIVVRNDELYHHGIKGQKWGIRRFQNEDGSLTEAGKARYEEVRKAYYDSWDRDDIAKKDMALSDERRRVGRLVNQDKNVIKAKKKYFSPLSNFRSRNRSAKLFKQYMSATDRAFDKYGAEYKEKAKKLGDEVIGITLKKLKLEDTTEARQYVRRMLDHYDGEFDD